MPPETWTYQRSFLPTRWQRVSSTDRLIHPWPLGTDKKSTISPEGFMMVEEIKAIIDKYLTSRKLFNPDDQSFVNVALDKFILNIVTNRKESKRVELLKRKFMGTNEVIRSVINSATQWYKLSYGNRKPIIRSAIHSRF
jgi:hypothetical protein